MEILNIYDIYGKPTGRTFDRANFNDLVDGEFMLCVHIYIQNSKGQWLVQKRSMTKQFRPGLWDVTAGAVDLGEDGRATAVREVYEELGIKIPHQNFEFIARVPKEHGLIEVWMLHYDMEISELILQKEEVDDVAWVTPKELLQLVSLAEGIDDSYYPVIERLIEDNN